MKLQIEHSRPPSNHKKAKKRWANFQKYKSDLQNLLLSEQYGLCAYSEINPERNKLGVHIEHIRPKSKYPQDTFNYHNLVASALSSDEYHKLLVNNRFGGHHKSDEYDDALFVSCLLPACPCYFVYLSSGAIEPSDALNDYERSRAEYTIRTLNLNCAWLVSLRRNWLDFLDESIDKSIQEGESLEQLASEYLIPEPESSLSDFFTATRQRLGVAAESVLQNSAKNLL